MKHNRLEIPIRTPVRSLCWNGDALIDWCSGNRVINLDGTTHGPNVIWAYRFDAALQSPSGRYAAIYERLGTKGLILDRGKIIRELNRSFYHADVYEYPIVFFECAEGRELVAHCPDEYNRIEIDEVATGKRLTSSVERKPEDFFHSRLAVSPDNRWLLSAGWVWHPFNSASTWSIAEALTDPKVLDKMRPLGGVSHTEINSAVFIDADRILVSSSLGADDFGDEGDSPFRAGCIGIFNLQSNAFEAVAKTEETVGNMMWLGDGRVVGFYEAPKVFDLSTGKVIFRWPGIETGKQDSSIIHHLETLPSIAIDPARKRFAVASQSRITVIEL